MTESTNEIYGIDLTTAEHEELTFTYIRKDLLKLESDLYETKWFDYRRMHPMKATYLFAHFFKQGVKRQIVRRIDLYKGLNHKGAAHNDFTQCAKAFVTGVWRARQAADSFSVPYPFFIETAMGFADQKGWGHIPKPYHLYSAEMQEFVLTRWAEFLESNIVRATDEMYLTENFTNAEEQNSYRSYLMDRIKTRPNPIHALSTFLYDTPQVTEDMVRDHFDNADSLIYSAKKLAA